MANLLRDSGGNSSNIDGDNDSSVSGEEVKNE